MDKAIQNSQSESVYFPPVVAVLGHVDHGKTSLLDAFRKTSIAKREFGGITQSIGASSVETLYDGKKRNITFIDTPGHEAFSNMRSHGAAVADIGLLIVSAVDGVMPQTRESIHLLKTANIPFVVVLTMVDLPTKNPDKVKQHLIRENVLLEGYGGDIPVVEVSSKTGANIKELLDLILLITEIRSINANADAKGEVKAIVIEAKMDPKVGPKATVIIKNGTIHTRDELRCDALNFRVRTLINDIGKPVQAATIGAGVEILGLDTVLPVGGIIVSKSSIYQPVTISKEAVKVSEFIYHKPKDSEGLSLILSADTLGSLEAIIAALPKGVSLVSQKTGEISEADVLQAKATGAIALSFNTRLRSDVQKLAMTEKVLVKNYKIIYEMLDEIHDVLEGKRQMNVEIVFGRAKIQAIFPYEKISAFGVLLTEGRLAKNDKVRIMHGEQKVGETTIQSLRVGKNVVPKVNKGEAGLVFSQQLDITIGDMIISFA